MEEVEMENENEREKEITKQGVRRKGKRAKTCRSYRIESTRWSFKLRMDEEVKTTDDSTADRSTDEGMQSSR